MLLTDKQNAFCVLESAQKQSNKKTVQRAFVKEFAKDALTAMHIWTCHKNFKQ